MVHPQVLHIGFSKCASTYLRALFRAHPRIHLIFKSGFFTPFLEHDMTFADYQAHFGRGDNCLNIESDEHLTLPGVHPELGVRTTNLKEFEKVADRIKSYLPNVKIIMVIRNQASLIISRYSEFLISGGSSTFAEFVSKLMGDHNRSNFYYQNYYSQIIEILKARFPETNLLILLQEVMRENTRKAADTISHFIGLNDTLAIKRGLRAERRSLSIAGMSLLRRINVYFVRHPSIGGAPPDTRVPFWVFRNIVRIVRALDYFFLSRFSAAPWKLLSEDSRIAILAHFREDNIKLQESIGRDLKSLGYLTD